MNKTPILISLRGALVTPAVVLCFFLFLYYSIPKESFREHDWDEGINGGKAVLFAVGEPLYGRVWSDQPPMFTALLSGWSSLLGYDLNHARVLVMLFSSLLVGALFSVVRRDYGIVSGLLIPILLAGASRYLRYSNSVMIGLPSMSFCTMAFACALYSGNKWGSAQGRSVAQFALFFSGVFAACSVLTKLQALPIVPAVLALIIVNNAHYSSAASVRRFWRFDFFKRYWSSVGPVLFFLGAFLLCLLGITLLIAPDLLGPDILQLFGPHQRAVRKLRHIRSFKAVVGLTAPDRMLWLLALSGAVYGLLRYPRLFVPPVVWLIAAFFLHSRLRPVWPHHYTGILIPAVLLAVLGVAQAIRDLSSSHLHADKISKWLVRVVPAAALVGVLALVLCQMPANIAYYSIRSGMGGGRVYPIFLQMLASRQDKIRWLLTDRPIYSFLSRIPVPPPVAVSSQKRSLVGQLEVADFERVLKEYRPEAVLLGRYQTIKTKLRPALSENYQRVRSFGGARLYIRRDLIETPG